MYAGIILGDESWQSSPFCDVNDNINRNEAFIVLTVPFRHRFPVVRAFDLATPG